MPMDVTFTSGNNEAFKCVCWNCGREVATIRLNVISDILQNSGKHQRKITVIICKSAIDHLSK